MVATLKRRWALVLALLLCCLSLPLTHPSPAFAASQINITGSAKALNTNGYLDFTNYSSNVKVNSATGVFSGYVFSEDLGWIAFGTTDNTQGPVSVDLSTGRLKGKAYVLNTLQVIDFDANNSNVRLTGKTFSGYVFSTDIGWIDFSDTGVFAAQAFMEIPTLSWGFNEGFGQSTNDSSGYGFHGTLGATVSTGTDDPTWASEDLCISDKCLSFDGGDYISLDTTVPDVQTVAFWVRPQSTTQVFLDLDGGSHKIEATSGTITATGFSNVYVNGVRSTTIQENTWQHIVATTGTSFNASGVTLGKVSTSYFTGFIDEFRLFSTAKSANQIKGLYTVSGAPKETAASFGPDKTFLSDGLLGYWKFDEASGNPQDASLNRNELVNKNTTAFVAGKFGRGGNFQRASSRYFAQNMPSGEVTRVQYKTADGSSPTATFDTTPIESNLLVVSAFSRSGTSTTSHTISGSGWTKRIARDSEISDAGYRRSLSVWTKVAGVSEPTAIQISGDTVKLIIEEFSGGAFTFEAAVDNDNANTASGTSVSTGTTASVSEDWLLKIGIMGSRASTSASWSTSWTNSLGSTIDYLDTTGRFLGTAFGEDTTTGTKESTVTISGSTITNSGLTSGLLVFSVEESEYLDNLAVTGNMSLATWIKPAANTASTQYNIAGKWDSGSQSYLLAQYGDELRLYLNSTSNYVETTSANLATGTWYHIAATYDANSRSVKLFVNGKEQTTTTTGTIPSSLTQGANPFYVGAANGRTTADNFYDGVIDDLRIYNLTLTPSDVSQLANWAPGPLAYWNFDENQGNTIYDKSGNNYHGTLGSGTSSLPKWTNGRIGNALKFDGLTTKVSAGNVANILATDNLTLSAWIKIDGNALYANPMYIVGKGNSGGGGAHYRFMASSTSACSTATNDGNLLCLFITDGTNTFSMVTDSSVPPNSQWYHVAAVLDRSSATDSHIYINGVKQAVTQTGTLASVGSLSNSNSLCIGADSTFCENNGSINTFNGDIDELRFYTYPLSETQIIEDMNAGHPAPGSPVGSAYLHYKLDEGSGTTANNSGNAGSTINGTIGSGTWTQSGKFGKALTFTASTSITATIIDPGSTNTLSLWVYPTTSAASKTLITSGKLTTDSSSRPVYGGCVGTALAVDSWTHIVAVSNGSSACTLYQNGKLTASGGTGVTFGTSVNIGGSSFTGTIDEVKLYSLAMSADQVNVEFAGGFAGVWGSTSTTSTGEGSFSANDEYCPPGQTTACTPPVAHWKFDENTGTTTTFDSSGNENHGAMSNFTQASWIPGKLGSALNFNNTSTRINAGSGSSLDDMSALTVAGWFYVRSSSTGEDLIAAKATRSFSDITNGWFFGVQSISDYLSFRVNYNTTSIGIGTFSNSVPNDQWTHLAVSWDGGTATSGVRFYVDGVTVPKDGAGTGGSGGRVSDAAQNLFIGADSLTERQFDGQMDDLRIYNYARTPEQISWDMNRGKPLAWYKFDECSGDIAYNSISSLYPGTISAGGSGTNSIVGTCEGGTGMRGNAATAARGAGLDFDGTNDFVNLGNVFRFTSSMSVEAWVYLKSGHTGRETYFVNKHGGSGARDWTLQDEYGGLAFKVSYDGSNMCYVYSSINPAIEVWTHVVGTYDATNQRLKIFVNGTDASGSANACPYSTITASNNNVWIGGRQSNSSYAQAKIDEVKIYGYALSPLQVKGAFNDSASAVRFGN
jgi:hypothetical protein